MNISEVAEILEVEDLVVRLWCKLDIIPSSLDAQGELVISEEDFAEWMESDRVMTALAMLHDESRMDVSTEEILEVDAEASERLERIRMDYESIPVANRGGMTLREYTNMMMEV